MAKYASYEDRFLEKTQKTPTCWIWSGALNSRGYGSMVYNGKSVSAHRFAYEHFVGPIPKGMFVCHSCDLPKCVNPDHLWVGTAYENNWDCIRKGRSVQSAGNPHGYNQYKKKPEN